ncbi:Zonadhesin [Holothuria leucospilota]|uniref:Zonadhesin n=1 Tax=Holothuria leucospilota TaxID=206669 RepID=A0A9Q1BUE5_HOLLE|nr:Zonadhesin [Holothuria leucospilota]
MEYGNCSCEHTCEDPLGCHTDSCIDVDGSFCTCPAGYYVKEDECVPPEECGCHVSGEGVIPEGGFYVDGSCTKKAQCSNGQLSWDEIYSCGANAVCEERNNVRQCYCNEGRIRRRQSQVYSTTTFTNCFDVYNAGHTTSSVYNIKPTNWPTNTPFQVYCNMTRGAWTMHIVIRMDML